MDDSCRSDGGNAPPITSAIEEHLRSLLIQSLDGDKVAYRRFLQDLTRHLRARLRNRLRNRDDDVEDLVQDVLLAVHNGLDTFRLDVPLTAWISAIARYKLSDYLRARSRREALHDPFDDESELFAASDIERLEAKRDVDSLLDALPERQRLPIMHVKLRGLSVAETATLTGLSESAVKIGVHRGIRALALKLRGKCHED
jgi:RNA polymerase sigma-70 factor (ECF subfamily)